MDEGVRRKWILWRMDSKKGYRASASWMECLVMRFNGQLGQKKTVLTCIYPREVYCEGSPSFICGRGRGRGLGAKTKALLFQSTIDILNSKRSKNTKRRLNFERSDQVHEQFTVNVHPALFGGGEEGWEPKLRRLAICAFIISFVSYLIK